MDAIVSAIEDFLTPLPVWDARGEVLMPLFSTAHQAWLIFCIAFGLLLVSAHHGMEQYPRARRRLELRTAFAPALLCTVHIAAMLITRSFHPGCLPLHLCNLCEILMVVFVLTGDEFSGNVLYGTGIIGALSALIFPGWTTAPAFSLPSACGFIEHTLIIAFVIMKVRGGSIHPTFAHIWQPLVFTGIYAAAIFPFNKMHGTNFGFLNWPLPGTLLETWANDYGNPGYIGAFALVFVLLELALFWPWRKNEAKRTD